MTRRFEDSHHVRRALFVIRNADYSQVTLEQLWFICDSQLRIGVCASGESRPPSTDDVRTPSLTSHTLDLSGEHTGRTFVLPQHT